MTRRTLASAALIASLATSGLAGAALAQDVAEPVDVEANPKTITGTIEMVEGVWYLTPEGGDPIELSFGPSWFSDLGLLFPDGIPVGDVTIGGNLRDGMPNENASETAMDHATKDPVFKMKRAKGKPPWAGGPKNEELGEMHPGFEGWSKGQADKPPKPEKAAKPGKPVPRKGGSE
ncbi:MAG: hypothetical protein U9O18_09600 [Chloroflexota bacterium]|nr:hypothetical protein [Chloroflexota bacterium]